MTFFLNSILFLLCSGLAYIFILYDWLIVPFIPFLLYAELCKKQKSTGTYSSFSRLLFVILSSGSIILYGLHLYEEFAYYPNFGTGFYILGTLFNFLTASSGICAGWHILSEKRKSNAEASSSSSPPLPVSTHPPASSMAPDTFECSPAVTAAQEQASAPTSAGADNERFYSERFDFICNSVSAYIKSELKNEPHNKAFTPEIAAEVVFPLLLFAAVTTLNDHDFEEYCFEALHEASVSLNKAQLYTNAVALYNTFVDLYNSYSHDTKEVFESWQYKASQTVVQKIQGSTDPISPLSTVIFLMDFTKAYIKLQREQEAGTPVTASPLSPPPPDSLRDPSTLIKTPDTYVPLFCRKCGSVIPLDSVYCPECGEKVVVIR